MKLEITINCKTENHQQEAAHIAAMIKYLFNDPQYQVSKSIIRQMKSQLPKGSVESAEKKMKRELEQALK